MAKVSMVERNKKRQKKVIRDKEKRSNLKAVIKDKNVNMEDRFLAVLKLSTLQRDGSKTRLRNRCGITGRPRGYYRRFKMSRIALREFAAMGDITGLSKSSW